MNSRTCVVELLHVFRLELHAARGHFRRHGGDRLRRGQLEIGGRLQLIGGVAGVDAFMAGPH